MRLWSGLFLFFFNDTATTEIYTLSLHDALPIYHRHGNFEHHAESPGACKQADDHARGAERLDHDDDERPDARERDPHAAEEAGDRRDAAVKLAQAVDEEDAAHGQPHEEGCVGGELVH